MSLKTFIIIIILLVILFVVVVVVGVSQGSGSGSSGFSAWQGRLGRFDSLIPRGTVTFDDVRRADPLTCLDTANERIRVAAGAGCTLLIETASRARDLNMRLAEGTQADLALTQPLNKQNDPLTARKTLFTGQSAELDLYRRQTDTDIITLSVVCQGLDSNCMLTLGK